MQNLAKPVSNYISSIERGWPGCKIEQRFLCPGHSICDYAVLGIVQLENPPPDPTERVREFEGYWMIKLNTGCPIKKVSIKNFYCIARQTRDLIG